MIQYINLSRSICKECKVPNTVKHLHYKHGVQLPDWEQMITEIHSKLGREHRKRRQGVELAREEVKTNLNKYRRAVEDIAAKNV